MSDASRFLSVAALVAVLSGCGPATNPNAPATISGKVSYKNGPVTGGMIYFHSAGLVTPTAIDNSGNYLASDLPIGDLTVTVDTEMHNPAKMSTKYTGVGGAGREKKMEQQKPPEGVAVTKTEYVKIPLKYSDATKSDLKLTTVPGKQTKNFELSD